MNFCEMVGEKTFTRSSGRVFPKSFKASPLLRSWLTILKNQIVTTIRIIQNNVSTLITL